MSSSVNEISSISETDLNEIYLILNEMCAGKAPMATMTNHEHRYLNIAKDVFSHFYIIIFLQMVFAVIFWIWRVEAALFTINILYLFLIIIHGLSMTLIIVALSPGVLKVGKQPYFHFLSLVKNSIAFDLPNIIRLATFNKATLGLVLTELKIERDEIEKKGGLIAGLIDKIGIFPAVGAAIILVGAIEKLGPNYSWLQFVPSIVVSFQLLNFVTSILLQKIHRLTSLIEYVISIE